MPSRHAYTEIRLQQLRSFCETARLGSLTAAAAAMGLAQPTVWEQVHALERIFGVTLIEREAHGSRLTKTGQLLARLAAPLLAGIDSLPAQLQEAQSQVETWLSIASTQRILVEDLSKPVAEFERRHPHVQLRFLEMGIDKVAAAVESGEADLGLTSERPTADNPWLAYEPSYDLDLILVTPKDHPLAHRRRVRPQDLLAYPVVNSPNGIPDPVIAAALQKLGVFQTQPRRLEAFYTGVIRHYVEQGYGIGFVVGLPNRPPASPHLHERSMSLHFGRVSIYMLMRKGTLPGYARAFADLIKSQLGRRKKATEI
jgi:LysR family transcriptional regulator, cys regulon transcriptional activator